MAIYRLMQNSTMKPNEISCITAAYEQTLHTLYVKDRDDPLTEMIAKTIIKIAQAAFTTPRRFRLWRLKN
jgi:hypothetical protein